MEKGRISIGKEVLILGWRVRFQRRWLGRMAGVRFRWGAEKGNYLSSKLGEPGSDRMNKCEAFRQQYSCVSTKDVSASR